MIKNFKLKSANKENITFHLLKHDRTHNTDKVVLYIEFIVSRIITHNLYCQGSFDNDIALLRLDTEDIEFGPNININPVCLPVKGNNTYCFEQQIINHNTKRIVK